VRTLDACGAPEDGTALDLDASISGSETKVTRWRGCASGAEVQLWAIAGDHHLPSFTATFAPALADFFLIHPKP
jgi:poly(3-hydroxybutyrate) depolymerase